MCASCFNSCTDPSVCVCVFAGTTERVCLIQGTVEALNGVHDFIAEKVREMPQSTQKTEPVSILQPQTTVNPDRVKQVRLDVSWFCWVLCQEEKKKISWGHTLNSVCVCVYVCVCQLCLGWRGVWGREREGSVCLWKDKLCVSVVELWFSVWVKLNEARKKKKGKKSTTQTCKQRGEGGRTNKKQGRMSDKDEEVIKGNGERDKKRRGRTRESEEETGGGEKMISTQTGWSVRGVNTWTPHVNCTHTHAHTHPHTHTHTHTQTHTQTHARAHAHFAWNLNIHTPTGSSFLLREGVWVSVLITLSCTHTDKHTHTHTRAHTSILSDGCLNQKHGALTFHPSDFLQQSAFSLTISPSHTHTHTHTHTPCCPLIGPFINMMCHWSYLRAVFFCAHSLLVVGLLKRLCYEFWCDYVIAAVFSSAGRSFLFLQKCCVQSWRRLISVSPGQTHCQVCGGVLSVQSCRPFFSFNTIQFHKQFLIFWH